ncbi:MAG: polyprenyl synthetase family protein [Anaerolineales bacterium]|nr:polyprenyl synthetase family protein [Anaerolineales bacterium]
MSDFTEGLQQQIEALWAETGAWQDLVDVMRLGLLFQHSNTTGTDGSLSRLARLPGLCCQAAGGELHWANRLTVAWLLFYAAADLMDSVQDQDVPDPWWDEQGTAAALNAASGLYFSASWALNDLYKHGASQEAALDIANKFYKSLLVMSGGQQSELTNPEPTLEQYWQNAEAKSGVFFSLACRSGARLAIDEVDRLENFAQFGQHLGLVIQLLDDFDEVRSPEGAGVPGQRPELARSLPAVFALEVSPPAQRARLREYLRVATIDPSAAESALDLIDTSGAATYMVAEIERHKAMASSFLENANPAYTAQEELLLLLQSL